jgi:probable HAF family extracellular repeat protein
VLDYEPVIWGPGPGEIRQLPLPSGDTVGYAFGINDNGQAVGMTGTCVTTTLPGPAASRHAVLWEHGAVTDLGNLGGTYNPAALGVGNVALNVNNNGQVVGSSAIPGSAHNHAFLWSRQTGMKDLGTLAAIPKVQSAFDRERKARAAVIDGRDEVPCAAESERTMTDRLDLVVHSLHSAIGKA